MLPIVIERKANEEALTMLRGETERTSELSIVPDEPTKKAAFRTPGSQTTFARTEKKYLLDASSYEALRGEIEKNMTVDKYGETTITSLYLDTPDFLLIRRSLEKPSYKEKFRLRSYGPTTNAQKKVFLEAKKKFKGIVYKRRVEMTLEESMRYLSEGTYPYSLESLDPEKQTVARQMMQEFDWAFMFYNNLAPSLLISCYRTALFGNEDPSLRITFDRSPRWRTYALRLDASPGGFHLIDPGSVLMEVKCNEAMPLWLVSLLDSREVYPCSFSKYGTAYKALLKRRQNAEGIKEIKGE